MALIARPLKEGGLVRTYVAKVQAGFRRILASEADADLGTIYDEFNGRISDANIFGDAMIAGSKINFSAPGTVIPPAAIPPNSIPGPVIVDNSITTTQIQNNTILAEDLHDGAVSRIKMDYGAGFRNAQASAAITPFSHTSPIESAPLATVGTGLTFGGSAVFLFFNWQAIVDWRDGASVVVRCYRTTDPSTVDVLKTYTFAAGKAGIDGATSQTRTILPNITFTDLFHPGLHAYYVTVQCLMGPFGTSTVFIEGGDMGLVEIA